MGMRAIPVPRGLVTCPWGAFGDRVGRARGSARLRAEPSWTAASWARVSAIGRRINRIDSLLSLIFCRFRGVVVLSRRRVRHAQITLPTACARSLSHKTSARYQLRSSPAERHVCCQPARSRHTELSRRTEVGCAFFCVLFCFSSLILDAQKKEVTSKIMRTRAEKPLNT